MAMEVVDMFTYVKLKNFMSFKDVTFDFRNGRKGTKRFIAIYGENGSGKSNFVTSIDFLRRTIDSFPMAIQTEKITELGKEKEFSPEILDILLKVKERTTVIFSTHILSDVERICDEIAILRDGKIALSGDLSQIKKGHMVDCLEVGMKNKEDFIKFLKIIKDNSNINEIQKSENTIYLHSNNIEEVQREVMQGLIDKDLYPIYIRIQEPTLERLFMEAIK